MNELHKITKSGMEDLKKELEYLKDVRRPKVIEEIKEAKSHGDLSENSEYDAARDEQAKVESRITDIEAILAHAVIVEDNEISTEEVGIGTIIKILDVEMNEELEYKMVGAKEADIDNGKLSIESPIGAALLNHKVDETVEVETPSGALRFKILEIRK